MTQQNSFEPTPPAPQGYPAAPSYSAPALPYGAPMPGAHEPMPVSASTPTNTVWIFLALLIPLLSLIALPFFDINALMRAGMAAAENKSPELAAQAMAAFSTQAMVLSAVMWVISAVSVVFVYLDWKELGQRGILQRFHWAWSILSVVLGVGMIVTVIGRTVVLHRQGLKAMTPVWVFIGTVIVSLIASIVWVATVVGPLMQLVTVSAT